MAMYEHAINVNQLLAEQEVKMLNSMDEKLKAIAQNCEAYEKLRASGVGTVIFGSSNPESIFVNVDKKDLPILRRVLGSRLQKNFIAPRGDDARKKEITVYLSCPAYPKLSISYPDKLRKGARCKIVTMKRRSSYVTCEV
jgi:hypothetical protein